MILKNDEDKKERIRLLTELEMHSYQSFDKALLALTSGAIGLSVTYIKDLRVHHCYDLLLITWVLLVASLFLQVYSYRLTGKVMAEEIQIVNESLGKDESAFRVNQYEDKMETLNFLSVTTFCIGVVTFFLFVLQTL